MKQPSVTASIDLDPSRPRKPHYPPTPPHPSPLHPSWKLLLISKCHEFHSLLSAGALTMGVERRGGEQRKKMRLFFCLFFLSLQLNSSARLSIFLRLHLFTHLRRNSPQFCHHTVHNVYERICCGSEVTHRRCLVSSSS